MTILKDENIYGIIGGGTLEKTVMEKAIGCIEKEKNGNYIFSLIEEKDALNMVCGGNIEV